MILRRYCYCDHGCPAYVFGYSTVGRASEEEMEQILSFNRGPRR
jgi:hypothetical protein